jgi:single-stranded DNA-binding protein
MNQVALVGKHHRRPRASLHPEWCGPRRFHRRGQPPLKHNGEWQDVNDGFFRCTAWRSVAENAAHTLKKGMRISSAPG